MYSVAGKVGRLCCEDAVHQFFDSVIGDVEEGESDSPIVAEVKRLHAVVIYESAHYTSSGLNGKVTHQMPKGITPVNSLFLYMNTFLSFCHEEAVECTYRKKTCFLPSFGFMNSVRTGLI